MSPLRFCAPKSRALLRWCAGHVCFIRAATQRSVQLQGYAPLAGMPPGASMLSLAQCCNAGIPRGAATLGAECKRCVGALRLSPTRLRRALPVCAPSLRRGVVLLASQLLLFCISKYNALAQTPDLYESKIGCAHPALTQGQQSCPGLDPRSAILFQPHTARPPCSQSHIRQQHPEFAWRPRRWTRSS